MSEAPSVMRGKRCEDCVHSVREYSFFDPSEPEDRSHIEGLFCARFPPTITTIVHSEDDGAGTDRVRSAVVSIYPRCTSRACGEFERKL